ncbi:MAG TPA: secretin N-terminal domain-containing protein, partial [Phycisphaerales bacterium]|nr:secretin N-terminal domain-containing protein [Phycisphaerales bacterium]
MTITCSRGLLALSPVLLVTAAGAVGLAALAPRPGSGLAQPPTPDPQPASPAPAPGPEAAEPADQPPPDAAEPEAAPPPLPAGGEPAEPEAAAPRSGRDEPAPLAFKNTPVEQVVPFIVEATGKVVMPQQDILTRRITVLNDQPLPRQRALDLVFLALQQAGIGVVQTEDLIILRDIAEITRQDVPVIGPTESMLRRTDLGTVVEKVFALRHASAENVGKIIKDSLPEFAKYYVDTDSNQVVVMGNVALLQRLEHVVEALDRPSSAALGTETYRLRYADATQVADNIRELFSSQPARGGNQQQQQQQRRDAIIQMRGGGDRGERGGGSPQQQQQGAGPGAGTASLSGNIRVTANTQQNSVTVLAEPAILEQIADQVLNVWDRPLPEEAVVPRIYDLKNSDPVKVRTLLEGLFGEAAGAAAARGGNPQQGAPATGQGVGRLAGQFS